MAFDFKKEYKDLYQPSVTPSMIEIPKMHFLAIRGKGNPNEEGGQYQETLQLLYSVAYTLRMSYKTDYKIEGYFKYVVPPLEGFWWQDGVKGVDATREEDFEFISLIRLPEFISKADVTWAKKVATEKKKKDFSAVEYFEYDEGLVVQCMHIGPYDEEMHTVQKMHDLIEETGYVLDISDARHHHEIYIGDPRKSTPENLKTILRHPIRKK